MRERLTQQRWHLSHRADPAARIIADRHYNRQKVGSSQFVPPGRCLVLLTAGADALWVTSWPFAECLRHRGSTCDGRREDGEVQFLIR